MLSVAEKSEEVDSFRTNGGAIKTAITPALDLQ